MTPNTSLHKINTPQGALNQAQLFSISELQAKIWRVEYLKEQIQDIEARIQTALNLWWSELEQSGKELLEDRVLVPHWKLLYSLQNELDQWSKPIKHFNSVSSPLDWQKASLYPCTDLMPSTPSKRGKEWVYTAPHRNDKRPSFSINIEKNIWHDWGTGQGGNVFDLYILLNGGDKITACKNLLNLS